MPETKFIEENQRSGDGDATALNTSSTMGRRWLASREPQEPPTVLEPEHPLMQKFQEALRQYLLKENDRVNSDIMELKNNLKKNKKDYATQMSQEMYSLEQEVQQQRNTIQQYEDTLESVVKLREERETDLKKNREICKEKLEKLNNKKRDDMELVGELDALNLLCKQYESWQNETDCDLAVNQRVSEKMAIEKQQLAQQQKDLDIMMYKLTTEVWSLEGKLELLEEQARIKGEEREALSGRLADQGAALAALGSEHARLLQAWGSVVTHVQQRDKLYTRLSGEYTSLQSDFLVLNAEIEGIKKEIEEAMQLHENITVQKDRTAFDLVNCQRIGNIEEKKRDNIENSIQETNAALEITDKELQQAKMLNTILNTNMKVIQREVEKLTEAKLKLEWETLEQLQARLCQDKATQATATAIKKFKEEARKMEIVLLSNENQQARILLQTEQLKERNTHNAQQAEEARREAEAREEEVQEVENSIQDKLTGIERKQISLETANKKITLLLETLQGIEKTPAQRKVDELEKNIADSGQKIRELQQDWLRAQGRVVSLSEQRQQQAAEISLTRKQIQVLEHKNLKLENEINKLIQEEAAIQRSVDALQARVDSLYQQRSEDQRYGRELEAAYNHLTLEYMAQLKDAEDETMRIEEDISELEEDKEQLAVDLHKIRKEALSWQKMVIMAIETKQRINEEKGSGSETEKMKLEIHRMQVRQAQLSRLANRLSEELAQGVFRRDTAAGRAQGDPRRRRLALPHALRDKRAEIRKVQQEIEMNKSMIETLDKEEEFLQQKLDEKVSAIADVESYIGSIKTEIEDAQLTRQKNLERLIGWQRCAQRWGSVAAGRAPGVSPAATAELDRQSHVRRVLRTIASSLLLKNSLSPFHISLRRVLTTLEGPGWEGEAHEKWEAGDCCCPPQEK